MMRFWNQVLEGPSARRLQNILAAVLILLFFIHSAVSASQVSQTSDEDNHYKFGLNILHGNANRFKESVMPISAWNALPRFVSDALPDGFLKNLLGKLLAARLMTVLFACGIAYLVFHFSRSFYGFIPALVSLVLFTLDPNILAHSQLVTTDIFVTGLLLLTFFFAWRYALRRNWVNAFLLAASLGFSQITKYTAISFAPLLFLTLLIYDLAQFLRVRSLMWRKELLRLLRQYLELMALVIVISILILNIAYLFRRSFTPFGEYTFRYALFSGLQNELPVLNTIPVPVPYAHLQGLDWVLEYDKTGQGHGNEYLLGQTRRGQGFPGYYIIAFFLKEPFPTQLVIFLALIVYFIDKNRRARFWQQEIFLFVPIVFYTLYFNFFYNSQIGIRYYLVVFPLLFVFAGGLFLHWQRFSRAQVLVTGVALIYLVISLLSYFPYYLAYFNESIPDRRYAYLYLADSNLDWGQGKFALKAYMQANPQADFEPEKMKPGWIIVSPNSLVGVVKPPEKYAWLRENFDPVGTIANEYLVYRISPQEFDKKCAETGFCK